MEAKRRKLDDGCETTAKVADAGFDWAAFVSALGGEGGGNVDRARAELFLLKKFLVTKERVLLMLERFLPSFRAIITFVQAQGALLVSRQDIPPEREQGDSPLSDREAALREAISVLANACHLSVLACTEMRMQDIHLGRLYVLLMEAPPPRVPLALKRALLRLLGNICQLKETASVVAKNSVLLHRVALSLELEDRDTADQALRLLRLLAKRGPFSKAVVLSNGCYHIAKYIVERREQIFSRRPDVLQILRSLLQFHPSNVGRQIAECSECTELFLNFVLSFDERKCTILERHWLDFIVRCSECSHEMRTRFGRDSITRVLQCGERLTDAHCRFLCSFTQGAYSRTWLQESGALSRVLNRLEEDDSLRGGGQGRKDLLAHLHLQNYILNSLVFLIYDDSSFAESIKHPNFIRTALHNIRLFLDSSAHQCQIEYDEVDMIVPLIPMQEVHMPMEQQQLPSISGGNEEQQQQRLCKDFSSASVRINMSHSPSTSPPSNISTRSDWSPTMSVEPFSSASAMSSPMSGTSSPLNSSYFLDDYLNTCRQQCASPSLDAAPGELEPDDFTAVEEESEENVEEFGMRQMIVNRYLMLISHFSHREERQSIFLLREELLDTLIRYISEAPELDNRLVRAVRRLARHESGLQLLLEMDLQRLVIHRLIRRPCLMARFARLCIRCDLRRDIGRHLLTDHALLADSTMGEHILLKLRMDSAQQKSDVNDAEFLRVRTLIAALVLLRREERRPRFYHNFRPVEALMEALGQMMTDYVWNGQECPLTEHSKQGELCCGIIAAFSSLLSHQHLDIVSHHQIPTKMLTGKMETGGDSSAADEEMKTCVLCNRNEGWTQREETLRFSDKWGNLVAEVPKRELCTWNEYFSGMFGSEFSERLEERNQFFFDPDAEACKEEDFVKFLHFSIGCSLTSDCVRVNNGDSCVALLFLADKYLCTRLLDHLLAGGIAARLVTGRSLRLFLPLVLFVPTIADGGGLKDVCVLVLLRYTNRAELLAALRHIANCNSEGAMVNSLITLLHNFMAPIMAQRAAGIPWQFEHNPSVRYADF